MYIDPSAGSLILQVLVASALGVVSTVKSAREAVKGFFKSLIGRRRAK
jgi:hypothetical protein